MARFAVANLIAGWAVVLPASGAVPGAPAVTWPPAGALVQSNRPDIIWDGVAHDAYEVHIGSLNVPSSAEGWNSGQVFSAAAEAVSAPLPTQQTFYVFVRLHNADGWGNWSAQNQHFYVDGEWLSDPLLVTPQGSAQRDHSIAFNPERNEYLVGYMDFLPARPYVHGRRLNSGGASIGSEIHSDGGVDGAGATEAAYNSVNDEYLLVGRDYQAHLFGQRVNATDGSLPGPAVFIHNTSPTLEHAVAYASGSNVYLEAWRDDGNGGCSGLLAQRLTGSTGAPVGGVIPVATTGCVGGPKLAYNSAADEFFLTYQVATNQQDLYCRRIRASDGALLGAASTPLAVTGVTEWNNGIAYDADLNRYFVAYEAGDQGYSVWGQFVAADATLIGSRFPIAGDPYNGGAPRCAWNAATKEYLVVWLHGTSNANFARRVSQSGSLIGESFRTNGTLEGIGNFGPLVVANSVSNEYMLCWQNSHADVYVRRYKAHPVPAADVTPPASVTGLTTVRFPSYVQLDWTNPSTGDFMGTTIRVKTTGFPTGPTDGTFIIDKGNAPGTSDSHTHTGLTSGTTYYYAVFAHDEASNYAAPALAAVMVLAGDFDGDGDIDQLDFAHLQLCLSGDGVPYAAGCADADLDGGGDVDGADMAIFIGCMGGANAPPGC